MAPNEQPSPHHPPPQHAKQHTTQHNKAQSQHNFLRLCRDDVVVMMVVVFRVWYSRVLGDKYKYGHLFMPREYKYAPIFVPSFHVQYAGYIHDPKKRQYAYHRGFFDLISNNIMISQHNPGVDSSGRVLGEETLRFGRQRKDSNEEAPLAQSCRRPAEFWSVSSRSCQTKKHALGKTEPRAWEGTFEQDRQPLCACSPIHSSTRQP